RITRPDRLPTRAGLFRFSSALEWFPQLQDETVRLKFLPTAAALPLLGVQLLSLRSPLWEALPAQSGYSPCARARYTRFSRHQRQQRSLLVTRWERDRFL